jgi:mannose-1-phosphate guanylyltransferase/mannose-6-phosphate isomerase
MIPVTPVILCGGSGSRLWPLSRSGFPKQFLCLTGSESLFQLTAQRLNSVASSNIELSLPTIVTGEEHRFLILEQLREIDIQPGTALLEPVGRNTAPALTLAALAALETGNDPVLVVTPSDQTISDNEAFATAIKLAIEEADKGALVILGITPDRPETGYGYIQAAEPSDSFDVLNVSRFVEKPDISTAERYLSEGNYYWNAGIFVLKSSVWLDALTKFRPDITDAARHAWKSRHLDGLFTRPGQAEFEAIPSESVDYAVMEHCPGKLPIKMIPLNAGWSDLGAWDSVWSVLPKDSAGNASHGDVMNISSSNTMVHASSRLVCLVGMQNVVVVETPDAVLVADKACSQDVKSLVSDLARQERQEYVMHRKVDRPWGWYDCIDEGQRFKVKRILVKPKASLSLQKHHHRAEHWVVVKGTAEITCGDKTILLSENQSTYIPLGETHRLSNPGSIPLEIIEVQSGSYLGEDDIVRLDDHYGRSHQ